MVKWSSVVKWPSLTAASFRRVGFAPTFRLCILVGMYVCIWVQMCVCICPMHIHMYVYVYVYMFMHISMYM